MSTTPEPERRPYWPSGDGTARASENIIMPTLGACLRILLAPRLVPRFVRRTVVHCPESGAPVEIDLLMRKTGAPDMVLRCSVHPECPPTCHQACRRMAEAVLGPARALIICPPGSGPPEEID